jgi:hypothetical protein
MHRYLLTNAGKKSAARNDNKTAKSETNTNANTKIRLLQSQNVNDIITVDWIITLFIVTLIIAREITELVTSSNLGCFVVGSDYCGALLLFTMHDQILRLEMMYVSAGHRKLSPSIEMLKEPG